MSSSLFDHFDNSPKRDEEGEFQASELLDSIGSKEKGSQKSISFFLGAGFSKSWNSSYPAGDELFSISKQQAEKLPYKFISLAKSLGIEWLDSPEELKKQAAVFRDLKYQIDIYKKYPSLLPSFLDEFTIYEIEKEFSRFAREQIEVKVTKAELSLATSVTKDPIQNDIFQFFKLLKSAKSPTFITTNYDLVVDRLIKKAKISEHPIRGVLSKSMFDDDKWNPTDDRCYLLKINGGFEIFDNGKEFGFSADYEKAKHIKEHTPKLIVPSREQNYSDAYFGSVFLKSCTKLRESDLLVFIGYSLPEEDYILRFLLSTFVDTTKLEEKEIYVIDYGKEAAEKIVTKLIVLFPQIDPDKIQYFNGTFQDFCKEIITK